MVTRLAAYVRGVVRRRSISAEVDDELRFHLAQEIEAHVGRGVSPAEAKRIALRDLGGLTQVTQAVREVRMIWLDLLWRDTRQAIRSLRRTPAFTSVALVVLTLSIGATTAIFSVVNAVILRGLPFPESDRPRSLGLNCHMRWALPGAPLVLALFAVALTGRRPCGRGISLWAGFLVVFTYYCAVLSARGLVGHGWTISPVTTAWTPNTVLLMLSFAIMLLRSQGRTECPAPNSS